MTNCRYLKVLDLSHTYIRILPIEICQLKQLYDLNLDECPLNPKVYDVYKSGIVYLVKYYAEKMQRENLRQKIVNAAKEQDRKSTRLNSSHVSQSRMPSSA